MPRSREKGPWFWRGLIALMVTGVFGLFAAAALTAPPATMGDTACRLDRNDPAHTVVLIDQSDPFNENDMDWVATPIDGEARALPLLAQQPLDHQARRAMRVLARFQRRWRRRQPR